MPSTLHVLPQTNQLHALHTVIRDRHARRDDFVFHSGRVIRLLVEPGLGLLVSIARTGESMDAELRALRPSVRIGKILIQRDKQTKLPHRYYSALPPDIARRHVLLLDPMPGTGDVGDRYFGTDVPPEPVRNAA